MSAQLLRKPHLVLLSSFSLILLSSTAHSAGYALIENSASGMGKSFAGAAAAAEDASTVWFNPAGMTYLSESLDGKSQISNAAHIVSAQTKFTDKGSQAPAALNANLSGNDTSNRRVTSFVPNLYYVRPINEKLTFGFGMNGPFGSKTNYDREWIGRYQATNTDLKTVNFNPSLSWKANDKLSFGGGISAQYIEVSLGSAVDSVAACRRVGLTVAAQTNSTGLIDYCNATYPNAAQASTDSQTVVEGDDISFGYNLGMMFQPSDVTRIGVAYRSQIKHDLEGKIHFDLNPGLQPVIAQTGITNFNNRDIKASVTLPESVSLSVAHKVNSKLELLGDVTWTGWQSFDELRIKEKDGISTVTVVPEEWEDVMRFSIGANYKYSDKLTLRTGMAFDEEPIVNATLRTPRIPGNDRTWLSFGAGYKINKKLKLDFGYSHLFLDETPIDNPGENGYSVRGLYDSSVDIISAQVNYTF